MFQLVIGMSNGGISFPIPRALLPLLPENFHPMPIPMLLKTIHQLNHLFKLMHPPPPPLKMLSLKRRVPLLITYAKTLMLCLLFSSGLRKQLLIVIQKVEVQMKVPKHLLKQLLLITPITHMTRNYLVMMLMTLLTWEIIDALLFVQPSQRLK